MSCIEGCVEIFNDLGFDESDVPARLALRFVVSIAFDSNARENANARNVN
jgi:hypothetical protein